MLGLKNSAIALLLAAATALPAVAAPEPETPKPVEPIAQNSQFLNHESLDACYSVDLPAEWDLKANIKGFDCVAFAPKPSPYAPGYLDSISLAFHKDGKSIGDLADEMIDALKAHSPEFKLLARGKGPELAGCKTLLMDCEFNSGHVNVRAYLALISKDGRAWCIALNSSKHSFPSRKELFDKALSSFKPN